MSAIGALSILGGKCGSGAPFENGSKQATIGGKNAGPVLSGVRR
jgi:hypothetical protein